jgi:hypothetical protein
MHALIDEINKHLSETKQRFDELEHAMVALADLVEQLVDKEAKESGRNRADGQYRSPKGQ